MKRFKSKILIALTVLLLSTGITACSNPEKVAEQQNSAETNKQEEKSTSNASALELKNGDRSFKSEFDPKSEAEKVIVEVLKVEISDDYNKLNNLKIDQMDYSKAYKESMEKNYFTTEMTVHSMRKLSKEEYAGDPNAYRYYPYMDRLTKLKPHDIQIIEVSYTKKVTEELNKVAQWGSGKWTRFYVMVKEKEASPWKIYDIYGHM